MKERFLPIGTIVLLKGAKRNVMITSYCVFPKQKEEGADMFDYGGCPYPAGIIDSDIVIVFNHDEIEKVLYNGYDSEEYQEMNKELNAHYEEIKASVKKDNGAEDSTPIEENISVMPSVENSPSVPTPQNPSPTINPVNNPKVPINLENPNED
ncbi:MAG: DUF4176 domain-containing protein [Bacilli bacterium]|nr:DUF4176 domain-containing protein [Bacilli bacterium]